MSAQDETEAETRADRIDPVLAAAGWGKVEGSRVRREVICPGRIMPGGKRGTPLSADYVLIYRDQKLAVLEAKKVSLGHSEGVGQAKEYATRLKARFAYASNGVGWYQIDMATGAEGDFTPSRRPRSFGIAPSPTTATGANASATSPSRLQAASGSCATTSTTPSTPHWSP